MGNVEQILNTPYAFVWLPGLVFALIVGSVYWLTRPLPPLNASAAVDTMVQAVAVQKSSDQRHGFRRHGNPVEVFITKPDDKKDPAVASVLDRSVGGVRLALYHEVEIGTVITIRPVHAADIVPWVEVEIRSCRPSTEMPSQFEVGCQYVKSPPYSIQLLFG